MRPCHACDEAASARRARLPVVTSNRRLAVRLEHMAAIEAMKHPNVWLSDDDSTTRDRRE